jgi:hypothetical protein
MPPDNQTDVAYFSMQIAVDPAWPTYARGPGVLAGDILRSAADMGLAIAGVTLLPRRDVSGGFSMNSEGKLSSPDIGNLNPSWTGSTQ